MTSRTCACYMHWFCNEVDTRVIAYHNTEWCLAISYGVNQFLENVVSMQQSSKCQKPSISMVTYPISLESLPGLANFFVLHNKFCNPALSVEDNMEPVGTSFTIIHHSCVPSLCNDNVHNSYMLEASNFIMRTKCCRYVYELFYDSIFLDFAVFTYNKKQLLMFLGALFVCCLYFVVRFQLVLNEFLD